MLISPNFRAVLTFCLLGGSAGIVAPSAQANDSEGVISKCTLGDQEACLKGAQISQAAGDTEMLKRFSEIGCELGNTISCSDKGMLLLAYSESEAELKQGSELVQKGCEDGYFRACANLGYLYYSGEIIDRDVAKAELYYRKGCDGGSASACRNIGLMLMTEETKPRGNETADTMFDKACELGDVTSC